MNQNRKAWDVTFKALSGTEMRIPAYAETKWEAIERVYSYAQGKQPDRSKYKAQKIKG